MVCRRRLSRARRHGAKTEQTPTGTDIRGVELRTKDSRVIGAAPVEVENLTHLQQIMQAARRVKGITEVARRERISEEA